LALTPICAFRPRRWRGALIPETTSVVLDILDADKRPVTATADYTEARDVVRVSVSQERQQTLRLLFDPEHDLEERILAEQFQP
jgi:NAD+ kinase